MVNSILLVDEGCVCVCSVRYMVWVCGGILTMSIIIWLESSKTQFDLLLSLAPYIPIYKYLQACEHLGHVKECTRNVAK